MAKLEPGNFCPLIKKDCIGLKCSWYTQMRGTNPNTGEPTDEWGCAVTWMPVMAVEIAQKSRQTGAAVESFRNEMVKSTEMSQKLFIAAASGSTEMLTGYNFMLENKEEKENDNSKE